MDDNRSTVSDTPIQRRSPPDKPRTPFFVGVAGVAIMAAMVIGLVLSGPSPKTTVAERLAHPQTMLDVAVHCVAVEQISARLSTGGPDLPGIERRRDKWRQQALGALARLGVEKRNLRAVLTRETNRIEEGYLTTQDGLTEWPPRGGRLKHIVDDRQTCRTRLAEFME
ncbi:MAG: hypothetical protein AAF577_13240 [Pseudomonadota bacterium]